LPAELLAVGVRQRQVASRQQGRADDSGAERYVVRSELAVQLILELLDLPVRGVARERAK
jgi:hypothetical protein